MKMYAIPGQTSVSIGGMEYKVKDGVVEVPDAAAETLTSHGFSLAPLKAAKKVEAAVEETSTRRRVVKRRNKE